MSYFRVAATALTLSLVGAGAGQDETGYVPGGPRLYYRALGSGPTVVVLHGGPGVPHDYLRPEWDRLAAGGRVVFYDQRGCGASGRATSYGWGDHVADLDRLIRWLAPDQQVVLAGSSWGTYLALLYALERPERVRGLVLSGTPVWPRRDLGAEERRRRRRRMRERWDSLRAGGHGAVDPSRGPIAPWTRPDLYGVDSAFVARFDEWCPDVHGATLRSLRTIPPLRHLSGLYVETLVFQGTVEGVVADGGAEIAETLPRGRLLMIEGAGHDPWYNHPDRFTSEVLAFLARLPARAGWR